LPFPALGELPSPGPEGLRSSEASSMKSLAGNGGGIAVRRGEGVVALLFILPNLVGVLVFTLLPILASLALSFCQWDALTWPPRFVGLQNYWQLLGFHIEAGRLAPNDPDFWFYLYNTLFLMLNIPVGMGLSLACALLLNLPLRGRVAARTIYFLPSMCMAAAVALVWGWIFNAEFGLLNAFLRWLPFRICIPEFEVGWLHFPGFDTKNPPAWLSDPSWAKPAMMIIGLWQGMGGYNCLVYLAGLQSIPREFYEAAEVDGAGTWAKFRHITWPLLAPTTMFVLVTSLIAGFQGGFVAAYILTKGGPAGATTTLVYYIYRQAFEWFHMGYAAALSWVIFVLTFSISLLIWRRWRRAVVIQY